MNKKFQLGQQVQLLKPMAVEKAECILPLGWHYRVKVGTTELWVEEADLAAVSPLETPSSSVWECYYVSEGLGAVYGDNEAYATEAEARNAAMRAASQRLDAFPAVFSVYHAKPSSLVEFFNHRGNGLTLVGTYTYQSCGDCPGCRLTEQYWADDESCYELEELTCHRPLGGWSV